MAYVYGFIDCDSKIRSYDERLMSGEKREATLHDSGSRFVKRSQGKRLGVFFRMNQQDLSLGVDVAKSPQGETVAPCERDPK